MFDEKKNELTLNPDKNIQEKLRQKIDSYIREFNKDWESAGVKPPLQRRYCLGLLKRLLKVGKVNFWYMGDSFADEVDSNDNHTIFKKEDYELAVGIVKGYNDGSISIVIRG